MNYWKFYEFRFRFFFTFVIPKFIFMSTYTIKVADSGDYIIIKVIGDIDRKFAMEYAVESHKLGAKKGILKYLVDATEARNIESTVGNFDFADVDMKDVPEIDKRAKVANLVAPDDHSHDFIETVTLNRGHNFRIFRDLQEALNFLGVKG